MKNQIEYKDETQDQTKDDVTMPMVDESNTKAQEATSTDQNVSPNNGVKGKLKKTYKKKINQ